MSIEGSGIDAMASDTRASGGDNSFPLRSFSGADEVAHFCLSCRKAAKASQHNRHNQKKTYAKRQDR